jgi:hypothetical protein
MTAFDWSIIIIGPGGGIWYSPMFIWLLVEIYPWRKVILFCFVCLTQISRSTRVLRVAFLVSSASSRWVRVVHWLGLRLFGVWKLLIIEPFYIEFNFTIFRAKVWKILIFLVNFIAENSNKLQKNWVWKLKSSWAFNVAHLLNLEFFNSENVKNKQSVHTWANDGTGDASSR